MDPEAAFWRQRYLELLQNHAQVIGIMVKHDEQIEQAAKLTALGDALKKRAQEQQKSPGPTPESKAADSPAPAIDLAQPVNGSTKARQA